MECSVLSKRRRVEVPRFAVGNKRPERFRDRDSFLLFGFVAIFDLFLDLLGPLETFCLERLPEWLSFEGSGGPEGATAFLGDPVIREFARGPVAPVDREHDLILVQNRVHGNHHDANQLIINRFLWCRRWDLNPHAQ